MVNSPLNLTMPAIIIIVFVFLCHLTMQIYTKSFYPTNTLFVHMAQTYFYTD